MVSDFIDEHHGFLALSDEECEQAKLVIPPLVNMLVGEFLEYGEYKEG